MYVLADWCPTVPTPRQPGETVPVYRSSAGTTVYCTIPVPLLPDCWDAGNVRDEEKCCFRIVGELEDARDGGCCWLRSGYVGLFLRDTPGIVQILYRYKNPGKNNSLTANPVVVGS